MQPPIDDVSQDLSGHAGGTVLTCRRGTLLFDV